MNSWRESTARIESVLVRDAAAPVSIAVMSVARSRAVVMLFMPGGEGLAVLHAAKDLNVPRAEGVRGRVRGLRADESDERVRREVARAGDHVLEQIVHAHARADPACRPDCPSRRRVERVGRSVDDRREFVLQLDASARGSAAADRLCRNSSIITGTFIVLAA